MNRFAELVWLRLQPVAGGVPVAGRELAIVLGVVLVAVFVRPLWGIARLGVTLAHEVGHALVGVLSGRRFVGFVLRSDMSGHAVTSGRTRGIGRILTTWAGYPTPGLVGAAMVSLATRGWAASLLGGLGLVLLVALVKVRSVLTALTTLTVLVGVAWIWWWRDDALQEKVLYGAGLLLLVGGWRHLGAVVRSGSATDDPAVLAALTRLPSWLWQLTFAITLAAATWFVWGELDLPFDWATP